MMCISNHFNPSPPSPPSQHASADVERLLIGNKCDWEARRVVSKERGEALAASQGIKFLETSAKTNYNIDEAFEQLARQILKKVIRACGYACMYVYRVCVCVCVCKGVCACVCVWLE